MQKSHYKHDKFTTGFQTLLQESSNQHKVLERKSLKHMFNQTSDEAKVGLFEKMIKQSK